jgi:hypothetical protein
MNLQAYANHRKALGLRGTSHVAVLNAINDGRLSDPAVRRQGRSWIIDPTVADAQWAGRTDPSERGAMGGGTARPIGRASVAVSPPTADQSPAAAKGGPSLAISKQVKAAYEAKLTELNFKERNGEMGSIRDMEREAFALAKAVREGMLSVIPRISADLAALGDAFEVERLLEAEVATALRVLADG